MATGGRPKKPGARHPCGKLIPGVDHGHDMTLLRRAEIVGAHNVNDQRASYAIGQLDLAGKLADPRLPRCGDEAIEQSKRRHDAALRFGKYHFWLFGPGTAPSHMKNLLTGFTLPAPDASDDDKEELAGKYGLWVTRAKAAGGHAILERAAIYDVAPASAAEEAILRRTLDAITGERERAATHHPIHGDIAKPTGTRNFRTADPAAANDNSVCASDALPAQRRQRRGLPVSFYDMARPDPARLATAIARLKAGRAANDNELIANDNKAMPGAAVSV